MSRLGFAFGSAHIERCAVRTTHRLSPREIESLSAHGIELSEWAWIPPIAGRHAHGFHLARVHHDAFAVLSADPRVVRVDSTERLAYPTNDRTGNRIRARSVHIGLGVPRRIGQGVLLGVVDVDLDLSHPDLPEPVEAFDVTTGDGPDDWITDVRLPETSGHGTHVCGIAVGRGIASDGELRGVAPATDLAFYKVTDDETGEATTDDIIRGIVRAAQRGCDVVNVSLATATPFMDGSGPLCHAVDAGTTLGTIYCAAAGNRQTTGTHSDFVLAPGQSHGQAIELLFSREGPLEMLVSLIWPTGPSPRHIHAELDDSDSNATLERVFEDISPRGTRSVAILLRSEDRDLKRSAYNLRITNLATGSTAHVHAYLQRTEPSRLVPSTTSYTVTAPAIADTAIAVGNWAISAGRLDEGEVHFSSSLGPRIDGVPKPDLLAPGTDVVSCADSGNQADESLYTAKTGTSMSSPAVCGAVALLLEASPDLIPREVKTILRLSADRVASADNVHGFGVIDCVHALQLAEHGVPIGCEPTDGSFLDRDEDRVPDHCQIAVNPELDLNRNGLFDKYETFFHRGDSNGDNNLDISDAATVITHLFLGGTKPICTEAADSNDDGNLDLSDAITILAHLFLGVGMQIPDPGPPGQPCGANTTSPSFLGCDSYPAC